MVEGVSTNVASTASVELEGFNGEWEVLIIWVIDEETMDNGLLKALGFITRGDNWAGISSSGAVFYSGGLREMIVVDLNIVDDDPPLVAGVDGSEWSDVSCF